MSGPRVSDHCVLRWLERAYGLDIATLRRTIADKCKVPMRAGAASVKTDGGKFVFSVDRTAVTSFIPDNIGRTQRDRLGRVSTPPVA